MNAAPVGFHFQLRVLPYWKAVFAAVDRDSAGRGSRPLGGKLRAVEHLAVIGGTVDHRLASGTLRYDVVTYRADGGGPHIHSPAETDWDLGAGFSIEADWSDETIDPDDVPMGVVFDAHQGLSLEARGHEIERRVLFAVRAWDLINYLVDVEGGRAERPQSIGGDAGQGRGFYAPLPFAPSLKVSCHWPVGNRRTRWSFEGDLLRIDVAVTPMLLR